MRDFELKTIGNSVLDTLRTSKRKHQQSTENLIFIFFGFQYEYYKRHGIYRECLEWPIAVEIRGVVDSMVCCLKLQNTRVSPQSTPEGINGLAERVALLLLTTFTKRKKKQWKTLTSFENSTVYQYKVRRKINFFQLNCNCNICNRTIICMFFAISFFLSTQYKHMLHYHQIAR